MQLSARMQRNSKRNKVCLPAYPEARPSGRGNQKKQWVIRPADRSAAGGLAKSLKVSPLLAQVLINRGITDAHTGAVFLRPKLNQLISPEQMPGVKAAVHRIKQAVRDKERITVYGDYDVDGVTGAAILVAILTLLDGNVDYYIPHRIDEGYGLNEEAVESLAKSGSKLLITVDCGVTAFSSAELASQLGLELIITDHHPFGRKQKSENRSQPSSRAPFGSEPQGRRQGRGQAEGKSDGHHELPKAVAVVHPALDESYANQDSSGSMVAFKLAWAIANEFTTGRKLEPKLREFMLNATSLAAMGTVADIVDLRGENRILTSYGLKYLPECKLCGVQALIESAGLTGQGLDSFRIGFGLAPMLNAAGRMGHARLAVELLTNDSPSHSIQIAEYLKEQNDQRRQCEQKIFKQACEMIAEKGLHRPDRKSIVLASENWHTGVIGIVASRIVDKYHRPTIMINTKATNNGAAQGSARSIAGFDMLGAINACSRHLAGFGGHKMAAGITIETEKIEQFAAEFEAYAKENLNQNDVTAKLHIDATVTLGEFRRETVSELEMLGPFGQGNPKPIFATKGVRLSSLPRKVGAKGNHLQLAVTDNTNSVRCIGFGMGKLDKKLLDHEFFNIAYQPQLNTYNDSTNVELVLADIQFE